MTGYDNWKLDYPSHYDYESEHMCEECGCEIKEVIAEESGYCEECECESDDCNGCVHCLSCKDYDERKAEGEF